MENIKDRFDYFATQVTSDQQAAAILTLAETISVSTARFTAATKEHSFNESLGREIAIGVRKGLFGSEASHRRSIGDLVTVAEAIDTGLHEIAKSDKNPE